MGAKVRTVEQRAAWIARRGHGVVTCAELFKAGVTRREIAHRLRAGGLIAVFRGVYRVGHVAPSVEARYMAAVKASGDGAVVSGLAAAWLWQLIGGSAPPPEISAPTERRLKGVRTRRRQIAERDRTTRRGIPTTTLPLTIIDISSPLPLRLLSQVFHEANVRYRLTPEQVEARLNGRVKGAPKLRRVLHGDFHITLSELERAFLRLLQQEGLPLPSTNRSASGRYVDCRWPAHRLTIELDSNRHHNTRHSWEQDRRREREAYARGDSFRRFTYMDVVEDPRQMRAELRTLLI